MATDWLRIANNPLKLVNHRLRDADFIQIDLAETSLLGRLLSTTPQESLSNPAPQSPA